MSSLCWTVSNNYSDIAKYDEKQQTKSQRLSIFYTRFISCSLLSCITLRMTQLAAIYHYTKQNKLK